jgi:hypothetical protein
MASKFDYDEKESKKTERGNLAPEVVRPRMHTVEVLSPREGAQVALSPASSLPYRSLR